MRSNYRQLGDFIRQVDERNKELSITKLNGVSIGKKFIPSIANTIGTDMSNYKIVRTGQFAYGPVTSRNGDKVSIAYLDDDDCIISSAYTVFEVVREKELNPKYLMLWFSRPEFDRYARFKSHGSVREIFDWDELCKVELPVPSYEEQLKIVNEYEVITDRIALKERINDNLEKMLNTIFIEKFLAPNNKETTHLENLFDFGNGKACSKVDGNIPVYGGNGILAFTDKPNAENVILIGRVGANCGNVFLEEGSCWVNDNAIWAKSKLTSDEYFDYFLLKNLNLYEQHVGTGQQLLTQGILNKIDVPIPDKKNIISFNISSKKVFFNSKKNKEEIQKLEKVRLLLLSLTFN